MLKRLDCVPGAAIVKPWRALKLEAHLAAHRKDPPHQPLPVLTADRLSDRHEVLNLAHTIRSQKAGNQDIGVREVQLLRRPALIYRSYAIATSAARVEDRREDARGVNAGAAVPVDRAISPDQSNAMQVPDQTVIGDRKITAHPGLPKPGMPPARPSRPSTIAHAKKATTVALGVVRAPSI